MIIKIKDQKIKIERNEFNSFWNFRNNYLNSTFIEIDNYWYNCYIEFFEFENNKFIKIWHPSIVDKKTCIVKQILVKGIYVELKISKFQYFLLTFLIGKNEINFKINEIKRKIYEVILKTRISVIFLALFIFLNKFSNNLIQDFFSKNILIQAISSYSIFYFLFSPFFKVKKANKQFLYEEYCELKKQDEINKEIEKNASI